MFALAETFLANLAAPDGPADERIETPADSDLHTANAILDASLRQCIEQARTRWPELAIPEADFVAHLARCLGTDPFDPQTLTALQTEDLYLALACAPRGIGRAGPL